MRIWRRHLRRLLAGAGFAAELLLLSTCSPPTPLLEQVRDTGRLTVATTNSPTTYYKSGDGETGFEYDLSRRFAARLGVELDLRVAPSQAAAIEAVTAGRVEMAAANLTVTERRETQIMFTPAVRELTPQLVYQRGTLRPRRPSDIRQPILVPAGSAHAELLAELARKHPHIEWTTTTEASAEDLLAQVAAGEIPHAVADSDIVAMNRRYFPQLAVALDLGEPVRKAWAFRQGSDASLFNAAVRFINELEASGELGRLRDRYFGHVDRLDYVSSRSLARHIDGRLPRYRALFEQAGRDHGLDWRLLAAISYQESHWNPRAESPTGVRGLMMLTRDTADYVGVSDRNDPAQSIDGGARYFRFLLDRLPPEIKPPDRVWLALTAYNLGYGHAMDLRDITRQRGEDPNHWVDLRSNLRRLTQPKWFRQTRYGYARGHEAEVYVGNVRTYLDVLRWITRGDTPQEPPLAEPRPPQPPPPERPGPLDLRLPVL